MAYCLFSVFSRVQSLQQFSVKNIHLVSGAGIRTHDLFYEYHLLATRPGSRRLSALSFVHNSMFIRTLQTWSAGSKSLDHVCKVHLILLLTRFQGFILCYLRFSFHTLRTFFTNCGHSIVEWNAKSLPYYSRISLIKSIPSLFLWYQFDSRYVIVLSFKYVLNLKQSQLYWISSYNRKIDSIKTSLVFGMNKKHLFILWIDRCVENISPNCYNLAQNWSNYSV